MHLSQVLQMALQNKGAIELPERKFIDSKVLKNPHQVRNLVMVGALAGIAVFSYLWSKRSARL